jgi:RHS repeat-associated protein
MSYDKNGNIISLYRNGELDEDAQTLEIDNLDYHYEDNSNRLSIVHDNSLDPNGFKDDSDTDPFDQNPDYRYDANGNMVSDTNKNIKYILYNHLNLPTQINFGGLGNIYYLYDATGKKLRKIVNNNTANVETTYLDGFQYKNGIIQFFPTAEGYANRLNNKYENEGYTQIPKEALDTFSYVYNYTDHLGNIRLSYSVDPSTNVLKIVEENHYYPFGLKHNNYNSSRMLFAKEVVNERLRPLPPYMAMSYNYKYNGKEYQDELGLNLYDFGGRLYDPALGRWMNIDPLASDYSSFTPYSYAINNPIYFLDPDGMRVRNGDEEKRKEAEKTNAEKEENLKSKAEYLGVKIGASRKEWKKAAIAKDGKDEWTRTERTLNEAQ